jgi:hypothetical protein
LMRQRVAGRCPLRREKAVVGSEEEAATVATEAGREAAATAAAVKAVAAKVVEGTEAEATGAGRGEAAPQPYSQ